MEVITVSPSLASPTEGDDVCETDVTDVAIHSVTLLICLCGLVGNGAVLCLLRLKFHNTPIYELDFADFFLLFAILSAFLFLAEDLSCSPIMSLPYLNFLFQLLLVSYYWVLFRLMRTRYIVDVFKLCCHFSTPNPLWRLLNRFQFGAFFVVFTVTPAMTNLRPTHEQQHCQAALISVYAIILLLFVAPVVIFNTFNLINAKWGSKKQKPKRHNIVVFLAGLFILLLSHCNFLHQLGYTVVSSQVFLLLNCIHSSIKPFIYFLAGRCWTSCSLSSLQLSLQRAFDE